MIKKILLLILLIAVTISAFSKSKEKKEAIKWVKSRVWAPKELKMELSPLTNYIEFKKQYLANKEIWDKAFEALVNYERQPLGKREIVKEKCSINITEYTPKEQSETRLEGHKKFIDIQISTGDIMWGIYNGTCVDTLAKYKPETDNGFYKSAKTTIYEQKAKKQYMYIFFPSDLHIPSFAKENVKYKTPLKKAVIKIENITPLM